jgi:hypothetical protein
VAAARIANLLDSEMSSKPNRTAGKSALPSKYISELRWAAEGVAPASPTLATMRLVLSDALAERGAGRYVEGSATKFA